MSDTYAHPDCLKYGLDEIKQNATVMTVCSDFPTTRTEAVDDYALADVSVSSSDFTWTESVGIGQILTVGAKENITVDRGGTMTHVAIIDGTRLLAVVKISTSQPLTAGNLLNLPEIPLLVKNPV